MHDEKLKKLSQKYAHIEEVTHKRETPHLLYAILQGRLSITCGKIYKDTAGAINRYGDRDNSVEETIVKLFRMKMIQCDPAGNISLTQGGLWLMNYLNEYYKTFKK